MRWVLAVLAFILANEWKVALACDFPPIVSGGQGLDGKQQAITHPFSCFIGSAGSAGVVKGITIPRYLWKISQSRYGLTAWLVPNTPLCGAHPEQFLTTVAEIERLTGLNFGVKQ